MRLLPLSPLVAMLLIAAASAAEPPRGDARDALLLLEGGPLHLRFHVALNGLPLSQQRSDYVTQLMQQLDTDSDGKLSRAERDRSPLFSYGRRKFENEFLSSLPGQKFVSREEFERDLSRYGNLFSYQEDESAAESDLLVFELLDEDSSGRIEPREMRIAVARVADRDRDRDQCISFDEFGPEPLDPLAAIAAAPMTMTEEVDDGPPPVLLARTLLDTNNIVLSRGLLAAYDRNRDRYLSPEELGWEPARIEAIDLNHDGRLSIAETAKIGATPVDLELAVDLGWDGTGGSAPLQVLSIRDDRRIPAPRPDLVRVKFGDTTVTFAFRQLDPVAQALEAAQQQFNLLDADGNGYLDRDEVAEVTRFRRSLFDGMDVDRDDKVYAEEMQNFVAVVAEPPATTCHVNIYNTGQGFFSMLDASGDGRVSIRELRGLEQSIATHEKHPGDGIAPADMGRCFHVEFVRGSRPIFGASARLIEQGPTFIERGAIGPVWFQAMDRNRDGDLTYLVGNPLYPPEFLGHPETAAAMDHDNDGLISFQEAEQYERSLQGLASSDGGTGEDESEAPAP
jgi:Ca2+-binding EF-hand superfamily protein